MPTTTLPDSVWIAPSARMSMATPEVRPQHFPSRTDSHDSSYLVQAQRRVVGRVTAFAGSFNILLGTLLADQHRAARGHRQRVVGMLQLNCEVDRRTADAFVDRWLSKRTLHEV